MKIFFKKIGWITRRGKLDMIEIAIDVIAIVSIATFIFLAAR